MIFQSEFVLVLLNNKYYEVLIPDQFVYLIFHKNVIIKVTI